MSENTNRAERFTVEGFFKGDWHLVMSFDDRETAIRGAGSVVISGAFEHVRIMLNDVMPGVGRELVRIDHNGTVRNGAFVQDLGDPRPSSDTLEQPVEKAGSGMRLTSGLAVAGAVFAVGLAVGNWAVQVI